MNKAFTGEPEPPVLDVDNLSVSIGQYKAPWTREELVSSSRQLAVERSLVNEYFNADRGVGLDVKYVTDDWSLQGAYNNGVKTAYTGSIGRNTSSANNPTKWAVQGRFQYKLSGDWGDFKSFTSSLDDDEAVNSSAVMGMVGACGWQAAIGGRRPPPLATTGDNRNDRLQKTIAAHFNKTGPECMSRRGALGGKRGAVQRWPTRCSAMEASVALCRGCHAPCPAMAANAVLCNGGIHGIWGNTVVKMQLHARAQSSEI